MGYSRKANTWIPEDRTEMGDISVNNCDVHPNLQGLKYLILIQWTPCDYGGKPTVGFIFVSGH